MINYNVILEHGEMFQDILTALAVIMDHPMIIINPLMPNG